MPTKIRLQRHGKKRYAYFHVVIADSRAPRDGKFIEKIGTYNPNTNPASIDLQFDKALNWLKKGAQPTDTVRALLSYKGVVHKHHLDKGVTKGAFSQEEADKKFDEWMKEKEAKIAAKQDGLANELAEAQKKQHQAEAEANKKREDAIAAKAAELANDAKEAAGEIAEEATEAVDKAVEATTEAVESVVEATTEAVEAVADAVADNKEEEKKEEVKAEAAAEEKKEEAEETDKENK